MHTLKTLTAAAALMLAAGAAQAFTPQGAECADHPPPGGCWTPPAGGAGDPTVDKVPGGTLTVAEAKATLELGDCLLPTAQFGQYSSLDRGKSALAILEGKCVKEYDNFTLACAHETIETYGTASEAEHKRCIVLALTRAQAAILWFGK